MTDAVQAQRIDIPFPDAPEASLKIQVGACRLIIRPGGEALVSGTYADAGGRMPLKIEQIGSEVRIGQEVQFGRFFDRLANWRQEIPTFDLTLGTAKPYRLWIETGASEAILDLGGLPITTLVTRHGAGKLDIDFSAPNPQPLSLMELSSGAGSLTMLNLGNANFAELKLEGGAAGFVLDFSGAMQRRGHGRISTGMASVELRVPEALPARIVVEKTLGGVEVDPAFVEGESGVMTPAAADGKPSLLNLEVNVALGSVQIQAV